MSEFSSEFGRALYSLAAEENIVQKMADELSELNLILKYNREYVELMDTPALHKEERLKLIDDAFFSCNPYLKNFLKILSEKRCFHKIFECVDEFKRLYDIDLNIERVTAVTCVPLSESQIERISEKVSVITGKKAVVTNEIDKNILGGVILKLANFRYDGSIKTRLQKLEAALKI